MRVAIGVGVIALGVLAACGGPPAPAAQSVATTVVEQATAGPTLEARFNATAAVGGGINAAAAVSTDDLNTVLAAVPQAKPLQFNASSSPPGARGGDVNSVSLVANDTAGVMKGLDATAKRALADGLLTAAGTAWPNASISLLISDASGASGTVIGTRPKGGPNTVLAS